MSEEYKIIPIGTREVRDNIRVGYGNGQVEIVFAIGENINGMICSPDPITGSLLLTPNQARELARDLVDSASTVETF